MLIENQLDKSNHDHVGKLITYLTAMSAKAAMPNPQSSAIWRSLRLPNSRRAISTAFRFFLPLQRRRNGAPR